MVLKLDEKEKIIKTLHRHWIVIANKMTVVVMLLLIPLVALIFLNVFAADMASLFTVVLYVLTMYVLVITLVGFVFWIDYYLDIWIITDQKVIDVEQIGMFRREVSEFMLYRVQDVIVEIPGFVATLLKYGNIIVHTAGESSFHINQIPDVQEVKQALLEQIRKNREKESRRNSV